MVDPLSLIAGTVGLLDVCVRVGSYLKDVEGSAGKVGEEIAALSREITSLISVNESIQKVKESTNEAGPGTSLYNESQVKELWKEVDTITEDCLAIVMKLDEVLGKIIGKNGPKVAGKSDGIMKELRRRSKDIDLGHIHQRLSKYQASLNTLLAAINVFYTRSSHNSTDLAIGNLSNKLQQQGFTLQRRIDSLMLRVDSTDDDNFRKSVKSTAAVASSVASSVRLNKYFSLPQSVRSIYTDREELLKKLKNSLDDSSVPEEKNAQKRFVVYGQGGAGKTQFCCKFAQDYRENFWGVFWIDASSRESAAHTFSEIAKIGGVEPNELAAKNWLSNLEHPWLLLIDNADDPDISVEDFFPEGERGFILVTTRVPENKVHGYRGSGFYHFEKLETEAANDLLLKAAGIACPWDRSVRESAATITSALGYLPLALIHAGKAIVNCLCELKDYMRYYKKNWEKIRQAQKASGHSADDNANMNVYSSYEIIYCKLQKNTSQEARDAIELLKVFSFLHRENIHVDILLAAAKNPWLKLKAQEKEAQEGETTKSVPKPKSWTQFLRDLSVGIRETIFMDRSLPILPAILRDVESLASSEDFEFRLRAALHVLTQWALITHHDETKSYSMHPLVHMWVRERPQMTTGEQAVWCQAATTTLAQAISIPSESSSSTKEDAALQRGLLIHVIHLRACQAELQGKIVKNQRVRKRPWPALAPRFDQRQAIESAKFSFVYFQCGAWKEAEQLQVAVKNYVCPRLGMENPRSIRISRFLATTYYHQGRANEAADLNHQVLEAALSSLGPEHPTTLQIMDQLGVIRRLQGRYRDSEELHRKAIEGMTKTLGAGHEDTLLAMDNLGQALWSFFRFEEAREQHSKAKVGMINHPKMGPTHERTLSAKENLAMTYREIGGELLNDAHKLMEDVLQQRHDSLGKEQPFTLLAMSNLAWIKYAMNKTEEAESLLRKAIPIAERNLGKDHNGVTAARLRLAQVLTGQKRYSEAEEIFRYILDPHRYAASARQEGHVQGDHAERILAMFYFVEFYEQQDKIQNAISTCDELAHVLAESVHPITNRVRDKRKKLSELHDQERRRSLIDSPVP